MVGSPVHVRCLIQLLAKVARETAVVVKPGSQGDLRDALAGGCQKFGGAEDPDSQQVGARRRLKDLLEFSLELTSRITGHRREFRYGQRLGEMPLHMVDSLLDIEIRLNRPLRIFINADRSANPARFMKAVEKRKLVCDMELRRPILRRKKLEQI